MRRPCALLLALALLSLITCAREEAADVVFWQFQPPEVMDGLSLVPLLKNPRAELDRRRLFWHYPHYYSTTSPVSSVRQGDWKLLEYHEDMHVELYNLRDDLGEQSDLAAEMPDRAEDLRRQIHAWRASVEAQMPEPNPNR